MPAAPVHPTEERLFLAACLAHIKRADGSLAKDWSLAETARRGADDLLKRYLASPTLPDQLTEQAYRASEDLRTSPADSHNWPATQAQAERVLPVAMRVLYVLSTAAG
ncbi:hypothetical protein GCM10023185_42840 [Hymenobacter saemangeumensis]|uniref:Uncharacterized protein n=1 Tax=Hymenobacter saemangeumensis TaxID=1084522 RepID=A0ABP8IRT8_9BACT